MRVRPDLDPLHSDRGRDEERHPNPSRVVPCNYGPRRLTLRAALINPPFRLSNSLTVWMLPHSIILMRRGDRSYFGASAARACVISEERALRQPRWGACTVEAGPVRAWRGASVVKRSPAALGWEWLS